MSKVGEEVSTAISEDFGFKPLGEIELLPGFNENVPFSKLQNLAVSNRTGLYVAAASGCVVLGELKTLRDQVLDKTNETKPLQFISKESMDNVVFVGFHGLEDSNVLCVTKNGSFHSFDIAKKEWSQRSTEITDFSATEVMKVQQLNNTANSFLVLSNHNKVYNVAMTGGAKCVAENACDFDVGADNCAFLLLDGTLEMRTGGGESLEKEFKLPQEISNELNDSLRPLSILSLRGTDSVVVLGNEVAETDEDVEYDQKVYVVHENEHGHVEFHESYDIAPAFGNVLRNPNYYKCILNDLMTSVPHLYIIASATSPEVTILDEKEVLQPSQDSDRAVLPINKETDNDTNPIGLAIDLTAAEQIPEPCQGVDFATDLPLALVLNNEGHLSVFALFHSSGIKDNKFSTKTCLESLKKSYELNQQSSAQVELGKGPGSDSSLGTSLNSPPSDSKSTSEKSESKPLLPHNVSSDTKPAFFSPATTSSAGQNVFGQSPFGFKPTTSGQGSSENSPFGFASTNLNNGSSFGFGSTNNSKSSSAFGKPNFGFGEKATSAFGKPEFSSWQNQGSTNNSLTQKAQDNISNPTSTPSVFGKPEFASAELKKGPFGVPEAVAKPVTQGSSDKGVFGKPQFAVPAAGSSPFGNFSTKAGEASSLSTDKKLLGGGGFASFATPGSPFANVGKTSSPFGDISFPPNSAASPFAKPKDKLDEHYQTSSPFSSFQNMTPAATSSKQKAEKVVGIVESDGKTETDGENKSNSDDSETNQSSNSDEESPSESENLVSEELDSNSIATATSDSNLGDSSNEDKKSSNSEPLLDFSSLAERIKKVANNDVESGLDHIPSTSPRPVDKNEASNSVFSKYTDTLSKGTPPAFSFANLAKQMPKFGDNAFTSSANIDKSENEVSNKIEPKTLEGKGHLGRGSASRDLDNEVDDLSTSKINEVSSEFEAAEGQGADGTKDSFDSDEDDDENNSELSHQKFIPEAATSETVAITHELDSEGPSPSREDTKEDSDMAFNDDSLINVSDGGLPTKKSGDSTENESFDELDDLKEELDQIKTGKEQLSSAVPKHVPIEPQSATINKSYQTQEIETSSNGTQTCPLVEDAVVVTDSIETKEFEVQSFEDDEVYLAEQHKPAALAAFYTGAKLSSKQAEHPNQTLNRIEVTFNVVSAEIDVLETNLKNIRSFLSDQSSKPFSRTQDSLHQIYTWRLEEAEDLNSIVDEMRADVKTSVEDVSTLFSKTQELLRVDLTDLEESRFSARTQFEQLQALYKENKWVEGGLTLHQTQIQRRLRNKMSVAQRRIESIEDILRLLKSYFSTDDITKAPMVTKIIHESLQRNDLLDAIRSLRKEVAELKIKDRNISELSESDRALQTAPISELKMKLDTKRQMGALFAKKSVE
ncbi:LAME_0D05622g1_1 [Lachancea meyersii CBS 8951]|uniref:LAME_0D05622g1_1 n=1 Tax=Lachancea meyersii CBS 8951 TaxID=1266667 RepID=A0A1G4J8W7_9SACH|nr:LAME_0D05622g1_1 [Lachancea meyersii CBS 8951]